MLDNFQRLIFGNSQSPDKFTGNPKITAIKKSSDRNKNNTTGGRERQNEFGFVGGKRGRRDFHPSLLWYEAVRDEAYAIYDTLDLCFPDTKTNKSKTNTKIRINNVN